jgi:hypothetical protein
MSNPRSLSFQASCIRDVLDCARSEDLRAGLEGALATIIWLEKSSEVIKLLANLKKQRPELFGVMHDIANEFPGVQIRNITEPYNHFEGSGDDGV